MKILALDQATLITGYALFDDKANLIRHGVIDLHKEKDAWERMQLMRNKVDQLVQDYKPKVLVVEDIAMQRDVQAVIKLGRLQGLLMASAFSRGIPVQTYLPTQWRKIIGVKQGAGIKRSELKAQAIEIIRQTYGLEPTEDEAEAISIGLAFLIDNKMAVRPSEIDKIDKE